MDVVVTGANGLVGSHVCRELVRRGHRVRALVRRESAAPATDGVEEHVGSFLDPEVAAAVVDGADVLVTTVAAMGEDLDTQRRVNVEGTLVMAGAARDAGLRRIVHVSTTSVYERTPGIGGVDEHARLVDDDAGAYAVTKREADEALADLDGIARVVVRPPAILGPGPTSTWNTLVPARVADDPTHRSANPDKTFAWVHVRDLARAIAMAVDPPAGVRLDDFEIVNVAAEGVTWRDYLGGVADAVGVRPVFTHEASWTGQVVASRIRRWGWHPSVSFREAMQELRAGLATEG